MIIMKSNAFKINLLDIGQGALTAAISAALAIIGQSVESGLMPTVAQLKVAGIVGLTAGLAYITKNFFKDTNAAAVERVQRAGGVVLDKKSYSLPNKN